MIIYDDLEILKISAITSLAILISPELYMEQTKKLGPKEILNASTYRNFKENYVLASHEDEILYTTDD